MITDATLIELALAGRLGQFTILSGDSDPVRSARLLVALNGHPPCGVCRFCRRANAGVHPDLLQPGEAMEDARWVVAQARVRPLELSRRLITIDGPRSPDYQNTLLKLLEELGLYNTVLWTTSSPDSLLVTVRSRGQRLTLVATPWTASVDARSEAQDWLQSARRRQLDQTVRLPDSWKEPRATLEALVELLLRLSLTSSTDRAVDAAIDALAAVTMGRPAANLLPAVATLIPSDRKR